MLDTSEQKKAKYLAMLLAQSVMPLDQKQAWLDLLPLMTATQVNQLIGILEREHQSYKTISQNFLKDLGNIKQKLEKKVKDINKEEKKIIEEYINKALKKEK